jgi:toxin-antitoxin system PIN domain toxin
VILLDVNVLVAAHRNDHPNHAVVRPWFDRILAADEPIAVPDIVWASFIRIATNRRIFTIPTPLVDAFAFMRALRAQPHVVSIVPGERHLDLFERLCTEAEASGDLAADAYLAAIAIEHSCQLVSLDRDFARFEGLRWRLSG